MSRVLSNLTTIINKYKKTTPTFARVSNILDNVLKPDHIALRSFKSQGGIQKVKQQFVCNNDYVSGGTMQIPKKNLSAEWLYTTKEDLIKVCPRIFISELDEKKLSHESQLILSSYLDGNENLVETQDDCESCVMHVHSPKSLLNPTVSYKDFKLLSKESEYAAWTLLHKNNVNHLALSVPDLRQTLDELKSRFFHINQSGGEIKTSEDNMLHQGSTMSDPIEYPFREKNIMVPGYFVEFVQRDFDLHGKIREGFESNNALHIFESTDINNNLNERLNDEMLTLIRNKIKK